jgi:hypothetical protein
MHQQVCSPQLIVVFLLTNKSDLSHHPIHDPLRPQTASQLSVTLRKPPSRFQTSREQESKMFMAYTISEDASGDHIKRLLSRSKTFNRSLTVARLRVVGLQSRRSHQRHGSTSMPTSEPARVNNGAQTLNLGSDAYVSREEYSPKEFVLPPLLSPTLPDVVERKLFRLQLKSASLAHPRTR